MKSEKFCGQCRQTKSAFEFHKKTRNSDGLFHCCKTCRSVYAKRHYAKNPDSARVQRYRRLYGITIEQYTEMLKSQNGVCAICKEPETRVMWGKVQMLGVDHDHNTGKVRALLCNGCNIVIGNCRERLEILEAAIEYLKCAKAASESNH